MIVCAADTHTGGRVIIVGITEEDIDEMRKGLTKTKWGSPDYGFSTLVVFMGKSNEEMIATLQTQALVTLHRRDDLHPNAGSG